MYFCRNCGEVYRTDDAIMCTKCGVSKGKGYHYCHNCGRPVASGQTMCLNCGTVAGHIKRPDSSGKPANDVGRKNRIVAGVLGIIFGSFGVHNFYLGYHTRAVTQLVSTMVGLLLSCIGIGILIVIGIAIWGLVEGILILCGKINIDGQGNPLND